MRKFAVGAMVLALVASSVIWAPPVVSAPAPAVVRKILLQKDLPTGGQQMALVSVEIPVGGREGRHSHPGPLMVYVMEGAITLDYEGQPTKTYKTGDTFYVETGKIHEGINNGQVAAKALATFVTPKGAPMTTQAK